ncbi:hypothetical protein [Streptomyces sp. NPDC058678]|uniref:hypothetical protein n=1 Tax=Streptomyces sp. NPDC058678 TaxID=3346595 RepID=UPI00364B51F8
MPHDHVATPRPRTSRSTSATIPPNILRYPAAVADSHGAGLQPELARVGPNETVTRSTALRVS